MGIDYIKKAVFLDRDGVLNKMIFNEKTGENEPPHLIQEIEIFEWVFDSLKLLANLNYDLFIVSNQPDYAKGKISLENILNVQNEIQRKLSEKGIDIKEYYYCYHHPKGVVREYSFECECRKPKTFFIDNAVVKYNIDRSNSWFIGDRESDVLCGKNAKLKTVFINEKCNENTYEADLSASNLKEAVLLISKFEKNENRHP